MRDRGTGSAKVAVVTGGAGGIGRRTVERLLAADWTVWVLDLNAPTTAADADVSRLHHARCDLRHSDEVIDAFTRIATATEAIDALVCSAGVVKVGDLERTSIADAELMFAVNVMGPWLTIREGLPLLRRSASSDDPARVVVVGSIAGIRPKVASGMYGATKAALHVLAQVYAVELAPSGITVNAVAPGTTNTGMSAAASEQGTDSGFRVSGPAPLGRIAEPDDIADAIMFLLGDQARFINGVVLPVDGGTRAAYDNR